MPLWLIRNYEEKSKRVTAEQSAVAVQQAIRGNPQNPFAVLKHALGLTCNLTASDCRANVAGISRNVRDWLLGPAMLEIDHYQAY